MNTFFLEKIFNSNQLVVNGQRSKVEDLALTTRPDPLLENLGNDAQGASVGTSLTPRLNHF